jgi:hypothetical protein
VKLIAALASFFFICQAVCPLSEWQDSSLTRTNKHCSLPSSVNSGYLDRATHDIGNIVLTVGTGGYFGVYEEYGGPPCEYPAHSYIEYIQLGGYWIGGIAKRDTLVSTGVREYIWGSAEFWGDHSPPKPMIRRSSIETSPDFSEEAVSEQDLVAIFTDTISSPFLTENDRYDGRPHLPLGIEVTQRTYAWSMMHVDDFVIFNMELRNIGQEDLHDMYFGINVLGGVYSWLKDWPLSWDDELCGFLKTYRIDPRCDFDDTLNIAYIIDNDGDPNESGQFDEMSPKGAAGLVFLQAPETSTRLNYNWWTYYFTPDMDFGPRRKGTENDPFRNMFNRLGHPLGDKNKYYVLSHPEQDYDQLFTAVDHTPWGWMPRPTYAVDIADGDDTPFLLSIGPFHLNPGETVPVVFAVVCGDNVHRRPDDFEFYFDPYAPEPFYRKLDFMELAENARWAKWVYDNPGFDTDGDGYKGEFHTCCYDSVIDEYGQVTCLREDTVYHTGDGVPDYRAATPPPPPILRVSTGLDEFNTGFIRIRWNGLMSETTPDVFSGELDFEGYRVYLSHSPVNSEFVLVSSYDREDYNRWVWSPDKWRWALVEPPFVLDSLKKLYGDGFDPGNYGMNNPMYVANPGGYDSLYYFDRQDWNASDLIDTTGIHKLYPDQPYPSTLDSDSAGIHFPDELTEDGRFKYFEYEYTISDLLPSRQYFVSVSAFDYGSPGHGVGALETKPTINMVSTYAQNPASIAEEKKLNVIVYPNPYRIDARYRSIEGGGFEGRGREDMTDERVRAIHFTNLPHKCTIRIFSIDGDLIREIHHDFPEDSPESMHDKWDLITRNTQAPVSGIYYYAVESQYGSQIGKIVLIM